MINLLTLLQDKYSNIFTIYSYIFVHLELFEGRGVDQNLGLDF